VLILGYLAALAIGLILGLMGGGGSILTVPTLVYLVGLDPLLATAYSLFVVGTTALAGAGGYVRQRLVSYPSALLFAPASLAAVFATRRFLLPAIPAELFTGGGLVVTKTLCVMVVFAVLMLLAATSMIRGAGPSLPDACVPAPPRWPLLVLIGAVVGVLTGFVGAGGGFLIIPALVVLARLPMKTAVGTSLLIIAINSLTGFSGDLSNGLHPDWAFLLPFTGVALLGIVCGTAVARYVPGGRLKPAFGWFTLLMGTFVLVKELVLR
jgi:uncharacterized protein